MEEFIEGYCYDIFDDTFMEYFRVQTGIQVFSEVDDELLIPIEREDDLGHVSKLRKKLQEYWDIYQRDMIDRAIEEKDTIDIFDLIK